ncbi:phosphoribosylformylglycinamidine cyclo-ligase [Parvularcula sp. ZS-1/3]|uniref:Phosphoribosylformylglycinamidine cyclo-ligase n=1 Tax=Parvularcula mediterranea TaxID=2732508 RepID=A0A7Y3RN58_9PROT|nr:phosphoribosylformylglycinamidine cyclo-ligase [Parvularcula mediterranea]NNU16347.1 phosphoribosylformylglycinamidine cyclo-ligase [Parvularcula mediterranea]
MTDAYKKAGVDIDAGNALVKRISPLAAATRRPGAAADLGGFGGLFDLKAAGFDDPILVSGTDGVGTKLLLAIETGKLDGIGIDLVAMCANDVLVQGAEPLFFLDYFATGKLDQDAASSVIGSVAEGCRQAGAALIGGETAEMPGFYADGHFDLSGFCVGAVERSAILPVMDQMKAGDVMIALSSSGAHSNGYSLIRKLIAEQNVDLSADAPWGENWGDALLAPTIIYAEAVKPLLAGGLLKGMAHITGGGLIENVPRVLTDGLAASFDDEKLPKPPLFEWLQKAGDLSDTELRTVFNCGVGMVLIASAEKADEVLAKAEGSFVIGTLTDA